MPDKQTGKPLTETIVGSTKIPLYLETLTGFCCTRRRRQVCFHSMMSTRSQRGALIGRINRDTARARERERK